MKVIATKLPERELFFGKGTLYIGKIKLPRSKKKRIRKKWAKKYGMQVEYFKIKLDPIERHEENYGIDIPMKLKQDKIKHEKTITFSTPTSEDKWVKRIFDQKKKKINQSTQ